MSGRRVRALLLVTGANLLFQALKPLFGRTRPPPTHQLVTETSHSLPSGHATVSIVVIGALVALAWAGRPVAQRVALVAAAAGWIGAIGASRVYLGEHWLSDVLAGWLVEATWLALGTVVLAWWRHRSRAPVR
ncbi:phosphatase PAP2 family protein [Pseudonocardia hispaniensis]|uniref:Phosphatase PAP2 family protein n=1 Tax=Pseudonocardia hispaniensis TaxID=904933 RepID=A0ABW1J1V6_9PSEU